MTVESTTQAICDLALRFGEGDEESMVSLICMKTNILWRIKIQKLISRGALFSLLHFDK